MVDQEYNKTNADHCVYMKRFLDGNFIILLLNVDNMLLLDQYVKMISKLKG